MVFKYFRTACNVQREKKPKHLYLAYYLSIIQLDKSSVEYKIH